MSYQIEQDWITDVGLRAVGTMGRLGHRCGYVGISDTHPLYGIGYNEKTPALEHLVSDVENGPVGNRGIFTIFLMAAGNDGVLPTPEHIFDVHGSLTYSGGNDSYPVESNLWWFGFDCGHCDDTPEICDMTFVREHCERLAKQLMDSVCQGHATND